MLFHCRWKSRRLNQRNLAMLRLILAVDLGLVNSGIMLATMVAHTAALVVPVAMALPPIGHQVGMVLDLGVMVVMELFLVNMVVVMVVMLEITVENPQSDTLAVLVPMVEDLAVGMVAV